MSAKKINIVFLLIVASVFAQCDGSASHYLPAIVNADGVLVLVNLSLENGTGDIYFSIYPSIGISAQQSVKDAITYAFNEIGQKNKCDVRIKAHLPKNTSGYIDGPSGGAAFTLMGIAALTKKQIKSDAMITGTISPYGEIGSVGGLYEKAKKAKENGLKYFLTPKQSLYERVALRMLKNNEKFEILEVNNIGEAKAFLLDYKNISTQKNPPFIEEINPNIPAYNAKKEFSSMAIEMMALLNQSVEKIERSIFKEEKLDSYFEQIRKNQEILFAKGYYFTTANDAFLNYLDSETIANIRNLDLEWRIWKIKVCLSETPELRLDDRNFEWVAGQELRRSWAEKKLAEIEEKNTTLEEEKYAAYREVMYADAWCKITEMLERNAPKGTKFVDEAILENLSWKYIQTARKINTAKQDIKWHQENAEALHTKGKYASAIIDSVFTIEMENANKEFEEDEDNVIKELVQLSKERRKSLWADIYASHGAYVFWKGDNKTAYSLFKFAKGLDSASEQMSEIINNAEEKNKVDFNGNKFYFFTIIILLVLLIIVMTLLIFKNPKKSKY